MARGPGWRPLFGQASSAQSHLDNQAVGVGDLFLFYGLYQRSTQPGVIIAAGPRLRLIWGWLEIGEIRRVTSDLARAWPWAAQHPHLASTETVRFGDRDTVYAAADSNSWSPGTPAAGVFETPRSDLVLTADRALTSRWRLPAAFHPEHVWSPLTYHATKNRWTTNGPTVVLDTEGRGQEFVVEANTGIKQWASRILRHDP